MIKSTNFLLCSTFHDPEFRLKSHLNNVVSKISKLFIKSVVCLTPTTPDEVYKFLTNYGIFVEIGPSMKQIDMYRHAIKTTLNHINNAQTQRILYMDFDRLIHWCNKFPVEFTEIIQKNLDVDYLHIGRTSRAFETHPDTQKETENIVNEVCSNLLGFKETRDIISVCYIFTKELGEKILKIKNTTTTGFYGSWPVYLWNWAASKRYIEVEGLEWETPDRFKTEIAQIGYNIWLKKFQSNKEWRKRVKYLRDFLLEISRYVEFNSMKIA